MTTKKNLLILFLVLFGASLACSLPMIVQGNSGDGLPDGLTENYSPSLDVIPSNPFNYSPDQMAVINTYGNPTRFMIIFTEALRHETWHYDTAGYSVVFRNGVKVSEKTVAPQYQEQMYATTLGPNQFFKGMGVDEVVLSTGRNNIHLVTLEGLDKESRLMHLPGLSVGLVDGQVNFVETVPSMTETLLMPEDFVPVITLTPEEQANEGAHLYQSVTRFTDAEYENDPITWAFSFEGDAVYMSLAGYEDEEIKYSKTGTNQYYRPADAELEETTIFFILTGFIQQVVVEGEPVQVISTIDTGETSQVPPEPVPTAEPAPTAQPTLAIDLSPEEEAVQGSHPYAAILYLDDEAIDIVSAEVEFSFEGDKLYLRENEKEVVYIRVDENEYDKSWEGGQQTLIITPTGYYTIMESGGSSTEFHYVSTQIIHNQTSSSVLVKSLTPEEALNQGTHTYEVSIFENGELISTELDEIQISFDKDTFHMIDIDGTTNYTRVGTNKYVEVRDDAFYAIFTSQGFIWQFGEIADTVLIVFTLQK